MIYQTSDGNYVAASRQVWIPGVYDSERTAKYAFRFADRQLQALQDSLNPGGVITMDHLRGLSSSDERGR